MLIESQYSSSPCTIKVISSGSNLPTPSFCNVLNYIIYNLFLIDLDLIVAIIIQHAIRFIEVVDQVYDIVDIVITELSFQFLGR